MKPQALIISNNVYSYNLYIAGMNGYGFHVEDTRTFEAARILLRTGYMPDTIIIDMKRCGHNCVDFVQMVHHRLQLPCQIILIGDADAQIKAGIHAHLPRPAELDEIIASL